jgi:hypothetical protein
MQAAPARVERRDVGLWSFLLTGPIAGLVVGVVARGWMRWITVDAEFSWAGTIGVVAVFVVFFSAQAAARVARAGIRSPRRVAGVRAVAAVLSLGLFGAAGSVMFPTVLFGSLALWRTEFHRVVGVLLVTLAIPSAISVSWSIVSDHGWSPATVGRVMVFAAIYTIVILATRPTVEARKDGWVPSRRVLAAVVVVLVSFLGVALYFGGIA